MIKPNVSGFASYSKNLTKLGMMRKLNRTEKVVLEGRELRTPVGVYEAGKLEDRLQTIFGNKTMADIPNYIIMAAKYNELDESGRPKSVALGKELSAIPITTAMMSAIAIEYVFPFQRYGDSLLGDAGAVHNFPLLNEHFSDSHTVIGVDLGYKNGPGSSTRLPKRLKEKSLS